MNNTPHTTQKRRASRVRRKIQSVSNRPRLHVFRSNRFISVQVIDDQKGVTIASAHEKSQPGKDRTEKFSAMAKDISAALKKHQVSAVVFDRGHYSYHGNIAQVAEAMRKAGIEF